MAPPPPPYGGDPNDPFGQQQPPYNDPSDPYNQGGYQQPPSYTPPSYTPPPYGQPEPYPAGPVQYGAPGVQRNNPLALVSMILGIVGLVLMCAYGFGFFPAVAALIMGFIGRSQINRSGGMQGGRGMALAGIITGAIAVGVSILIFILFLVFGLVGALTNQGG